MPQNGPGLVGRDIAPVLRQPVARIIANAETIRTRLAGPLREEYSEYAGTIASAGQHLAAMLDDLADLEVVEASAGTVQAQVRLIDASLTSLGSVTSTLLVAHQNVTDLLRIHQWVIGWENRSTWQTKDSVNTQHL